MKNAGKLIVSPTPYLDEGLFGRVYLWIFEILPYLHSRGIYPAWHIESSLYGVGNQQIAIPGVLDLAYQPPTEFSGETSLVDLRNRHSSSLGPDWQALHELWSSYFAIPRRVYDSADEILITRSTLGVHYRGTDKVISSWDSNMLSKDDMIVIVEDYLIANPDMTRIFLATDEDEFVEMLRDRVNCEVISLGGATHHKAEARTKRTDYRDADRANLDCVLLSRCATVLVTSSALSAFAKVLNPNLMIFRCAASKMLWDGPYFPIAYIPVYNAQSKTGKDILMRTLAHDWTGDDRAKRYLNKFVSKPNWVWRLAACKRALKRLVRLGKRNRNPIEFFYR